MLSYFPRRQGVSERDPVTKHCPPEYQNPRCLYDRAAHAKLKQMVLECSDTASLEVVLPHAQDALLKLTKPGKFGGLSPMNAYHPPEVNALCRLEKENMKSKTKDFLRGELIPLVEEKLKQLKTPRQLPATDSAPSPSAAADLVQVFSCAG